MPKRRPADDRRIYCRPPATNRCPGSHRWGACRSSSGHRSKILSFAERIGRWPNSLPAVAGRRPLHDFCDMVQGRENPAMTCRCQKVGIGEKSWDRRTIYKACDVPLSWGPWHASVGYSLRPTRTSSLSMHAVCLSHCYKVLSDPIWWELDE